MGGRKFRYQGYRFYSHGVPTGNTGEQREDEVKKKRERIELVKI